MFNLLQDSKHNKPNKLNKVSLFSNNSHNNNKLNNNNKQFKHQFKVNHSQDKEFSFLLWLKT